MSKKLEYQALTIPKVTWNKKDLTKNYGEFVAQPLEPGFGITLGNALRRTMLSSVEGAAITSVIIKGVNNEFSSLPNVVEDVMQIALNLKEVVIRSKDGKPGKMKLKFEGEGVVKVSDIEVDSNVELINKDHVIAHLSEGGSLEIDFFVESGRGYQPAKWPIGQALQEDNKIYLDAMFSSVVKVYFDVEKTRIGQDIGYDKLIFRITTDGSQTPTEILHYAVSVVRTQFEHFLIEPEIPFNEISKVVEEETEEVVVETKDVGLKGVPVDLLMKTIDELELSARAHNCLITSGIKRVIDLVNLSEEEGLNIKNFGRKSLREVKESMKAFGLSFGMNIKESDIKNLQKTEE
jgi:DNA-directed RNA polymerase subunit alpha